MASSKRAKAAKPSARKKATARKPVATKRAETKHAEKKLAAKKRAEKTRATPKPARELTWEQLVAVLGRPHDDADVLDIVKRLGLKRPSTDHMGYVDAYAKRFGIELFFEEAQAACVAGAPGDKLLLQRIAFAVNEPRDGGIWKGGLPEWLHRDSSVADVAPRGTRSGEEDEPRFAVKDAGLELDLQFAPLRKGKRVALVEVTAYPEGYEDGRRRRFVDDMLKERGPEAFPDCLQFSPYSNDELIWVALEQRIGAEAAAARRAAVEN
jgi:hypothetical protein